MKRTIKIESRSKIGRPKSFRRDVALNKAMLTFWKYGYETTSMALLALQMKMNAPSIYAEFGDKKELFLKALDRYIGNTNDIKVAMNNSSSSYEAARELLYHSATRFTEKNMPSGCMLASAVASGSPACADVQAAASKIRSRIEVFLKARIQRDIKTGSLPSNTSAVALAGLTIATIQGMSVLARDGASRKKLLLIADVSLSAWT